MNPACKLCRGACCESLMIPLPADEGAAMWLSLHGRPGFPGTVRLECACRKLRDGKCTIHDSRPSVCVDYPVGGESCRATVRLRRPGMAAEILELMGPE